ncbi:MULTISPECIES: arylsulfatase [unclassified Lentimonas]|uniref:sulfatase family protein n=1 Tax=unclassified Lentimonas TaxID=2630993 RepID=UPI001323B3B7|nr:MULTISPECIES: arylsulfatase [unclassified Lentimonas]CAA6696527.1 Choline-sulfatase (EC [Lentimonas sp. CC19]CAA6696665.1 Choline-sulfatase (EC [Lentimonas sp. CC10]CAA7072453.1 Choline-sulfatase (EC [Lentimonas sp. CC11]
MFHTLSLRNTFQRLSLVALLISVAAVLQASEKPNIVVLMADDIGLGDVSFYQRLSANGKVTVETPNIDRLIGEGMRFSDAHAPASLCAPTRFSMLTGNFSYRNRKPFGVWTPDANSGIEPKFTTSARIAKAGGYRTAFFGKWGLGSSLDNRKKPMPELSEGACYFGFDYAFELPQGIQSPPYAFYENQKWVPLQPDSALVELDVEQIGYGGIKKHANEHGIGDSNWDPTQAGPILIEKAVAYIDRHAAEQPTAPFFLYYCSQAVHVPHTPAKELDGVTIAGATGGPHRDMIHELDVQVGMLVKALKRGGLYENTLFIFTSDNGGLSFDKGHDSSNDLLGKKGSVNEGGHRIPFIAVWPRKIAANSESKEPIVGHDVVATIAALADQPLDRAVVMDSIDLLPILTNDPSGQRHAYLMHQSSRGPRYALREGPWKLIIGPDGGKVEKAGAATKSNPVAGLKDLVPIALFNLDSNLTENESQNLLSNPEQAQRIAQMQAKYIELRVTESTTLTDQ